MTVRQNHNGYTLVEMLAAMLVLGLAMTALAQSTRLFASTSRHASVVSSEVARARSVEMLLQRALGPGPFAPESAGSEAVLRGDQAAMTYDCGKAKACELRLVDRPTFQILLRGGRSGSTSLDGMGFKFRYVVGGRALTAYPTAAVERPLEGIAVVDQNGRVLAAWRPQSDQSPTCAFDYFNHRCFPKQEGAAQ